MKNIELKQFLRKEKKHQTIFLNDRFYKFGSKREALKFISEIESSCESGFNLINSLQIELYSIYRNSYRFLKPFIEVQIKTQLSDSEKSLNLVFNSSNYQNGNVFVFSHLYSSIKFLHSTIDLLNQTENNPILKNQLLMLSQRLQQARSVLVFNESEMHNYAASTFPTSINFKKLA